jgi:molecular chaperone HscC
LQSLKYYPREDLTNQRLLRYCERLVGEVSPFHRSSFEAAIDGFERAMGTGDKESVEFAQDGLLQMLSMLGYEFGGDHE